MSAERMFILAVIAVTGLFAGHRLADEAEVVLEPPYEALLAGMEIDQ